MAGSLWYFHHREPKDLAVSIEKFELSKYIFWS